MRARLGRGLTCTVCVCVPSATPAAETEEEEITEEEEEDPTVCARAAGGGQRVSHVAPRPASRRGSHQHCLGLGASSRHPCGARTHGEHLAEATVSSAVHNTPCSWLTLPPLSAPRSCWRKCAARPLMPDSPKPSARPSGCVSAIARRGQCVPVRLVLRGDRCLAHHQQLASRHQGSGASRAPSALRVRPHRVRRHVSGARRDSLRPCGSARVGRGAVVSLSLTGGAPAQLVYKNREDSVTNKMRAMAAKTLALASSMFQLRCTRNYTRVASLADFQFQRPAVRPKTVELFDLGGLDVESPSGAPPPAPAADRNLWVEEGAGLAFYRQVRTVPPAPAAVWLSVCSGVPCRAVRPDPSGLCRHPRSVCPAAHDPCAGARASRTADPARAALRSAHADRHHRRRP
jgi:hypothetical protein